MEILLMEKVEGIVCEDVVEGEDVSQIVDNMVNLIAEKGGYGLSAPQIGINKKIIIWEGKPGEIHVGANPIYYKDGKVINTVESCLSYPDQTFFIERYKYIRAVYYAFTQDGKMLKVNRTMRGEEAIAFQHETDHIYGITLSTKGKKI